VDKKLLILILVSVLGFGTIIFSASRSAAREVVTVSELVASGVPASNVRLGARVSSRQIDYDTSGTKFKVGFKVIDIPKKESPSDRVGAASDTISVLYYGIKPDTLQPGRDVILEGSFGPEKVFTASTLLTQCPSKYEPPSVSEEVGDSESGVKTKIYD